jgi:hypothetical protein
VQFADAKPDSEQKPNLCICWQSTLINHASLDMPHMAVSLGPDPEHMSGAVKMALDAGRLCLSTSVETRSSVHTFSFSWPSALMLVDLASYFVHIPVMAQSTVLA